MSDWGTHTYAEMAHIYIDYYERLILETGHGAYNLDVVRLWQEALIASPPDPDNVQTLLALLAPADDTKGLHDGSVWYEVRKVVRKWAEEQNIDGGSVDSR